MAYFMEYDFDRAGGFEPLRFVPKGNKMWCSASSPRSAARWNQGRAEAPHRRGDEVYRARSALPVAAMRLRFDRGGQYPDREPAMGQDAQIVEFSKEVWGGLSLGVVPAKAGPPKLRAPGALEPPFAGR